MLNNVTPPTHIHNCATIQVKNEHIQGKNELKTHTYHVLHLAEEAWQVNLKKRVAKLRADIAQNQTKQHLLLSVSYDAKNMGDR